MPTKIVSCLVKETRFIRGRGVLAICEICGHQTMSYGTDGPSVRRCLALMRAECPNRLPGKPSNFYVRDRELGGPYGPNLPGGRGDRPTD